MAYTISSSSPCSWHRLDGGAGVAARRSRDASRGVVHVVRSECLHDAVIGGIRGVTGLKEDLIGAGLPVSRTYRRNRVVCDMRLRSTTPLAGPVYFVSHGGEEFPDLVIVLEGDGVRVDLVGDTFIDKAGIMSSTFRTVPDVPVNTFELFLPQGLFSALAANANLCKQRAKLVMPTGFVAQNGAVFKQSTKIKVTGCYGLPFPVSVVEGVCNAKWVWFDR